MTHHLLTDKLLDSILTAAVTYTDQKGMQCTWICDTHTPGIREWMHYNPYQYTVKEMVVSEIMPTYDDSERVDNFVFIPVDLIRCSYDQLLRIAHANPNLMGVHENTSGLLHSLQNLLIHTNPLNGKYIVVARLKDTLTGIEREWLKLWHDFNWEYMSIDDPELWTATDNIKASYYRQGLSMGISARRMSTILDPKYRA